MRPIADLLGTDISITTRCGCLRVVQFSAELLVQRFGAAATVESIEARLRCRDCRQRPTLVFSWSWTNIFGLTRGVPLPQVPEWTELTEETARAALLRTGQ
jgi:hypothetical protein